MTNDPRDDALAWRRKYQEGVEELDRAEQRVEELEEFLRHSVARIARGVMGVDGGLDAHIEPLLNAVREEQAPSAIAELALAVQESGRARVETADGGVAEAVEDDGVLAELREGLGQLAFELPLSVELRERAESLRDGLAGMTPAVGIAAACELAAALRIEVESERVEMRNYLERLDQQLRGLGDLLGDQVAESLAETQMRGLLGEQIDTQLDGMRRAVADAEDVEPLRRAVTDRIAALETGMSEYLAAEAERRARIEASSRRAEERLAELQRESAELTERLAAVRKEAIRDKLTGCFNRAELDTRLAGEIERFGRGEGSLAVVIGDVDHFKRVNDTHGHLIGDKLLRAVAGVLQRGVRAVDFVARYGGEEFVLLLPETGLDGAAQLAEELRKRVAKRGFLHRGSRIRMSMSFGVAEVAAGDSAKDVLERADRALYAAKSAGRDRVMVEGTDRAA